MSTNKIEEAKKIEAKKLKELKGSIPDQLNITLITSIPGSQKITYKPHMTIKDLSESTVRFDPTIKLNQSVVNTVPEKLRIKQFFDSGLYESLKNLTLANSPKDKTQYKSLDELEKLGIVDNNLKIIVDTIFPVNSVIYIKNNPYVIIDCKWSKSKTKSECIQKKEELDKKTK